MRIEPLTPADTLAVDALLDEAFGTDRHTRTAYRLRAGNSPLPHLSLAVREHDVLVGSIQCWPILFVDEIHCVTPLILLGPIAVAATHRGHGIGSALIQTALARAGTTPVMLVGDAPYYGRFGFTADHTGRWTLPGPVERARLLARGAAALERAGNIHAVTAVRAAA